MQKNTKICNGLKFTMKEPQNKSTQLSQQDATLTPEVSKFHLEKFKLIN